MWFWIDVHKRDLVIEVWCCAGSEASSPTCEVFLGGSCNPTTWRTEIAIPKLKKMGISYFNPVSFTNAHNRQFIYFIPTIISGSTIYLPTQNGTKTWGVMVLVLKHVRIVCHSSSLIEQFTPQCNQQEMKLYSMIDQPTNLPSFLITYQQRRLRLYFDGTRSLI